MPDDQTVRVGNLRSAQVGAEAGDQFSGLDGMKLRLVAAPKQRNTEAERAAIKTG